VKLLNLSNYNQTAKLIWLGLLALSGAVVLSAFYECFKIEAMQLSILVMLACFIVLAKFFSIKIQGTTEAVIVTETFVFLGIIFISVPAGVLLGLLEILVCRMRAGRQLKNLLDASVISSISVFMGGSFFYLTLQIYGGIDTKPIGLVPLKAQYIITALSILALIYFCANRFLVAVLLALENKKNVWENFIKNFSYTSWNSLIGVLGAGILYVAFSQKDYVIGIVSLPIVILPYLAYQIHFRRIAEKTEENNQVGQLFIAAVEALSTAIEAREQLSPGHTRRVQVYAVEMGKMLNLPADEIKALEIAALLHGVGKLAVPDHILNKQGKLTPHEKERVNIYPLVSAEIVETVGFPYPVANVIRYFHENWDGEGYPEGLRGEEIPLTARILGIADTFDTLRTARPYREAYTREEARKTLLAEAGQRFDPKLVDFFLRHLVQYEQLIATLELPSNIEKTEEESRSAIDVRQKAPHYLEQIHQANREVFALYELARISSGSLSLKELLPFVTVKVQELVPCDTCIVYLTDEESGIATAVHAAGSNAAALQNRKVVPGEGVTGFVLKNEKSICSVNPALDFTNDLVGIAQDYLTMAALPLKANNRLIGVLTVYSQSLLGYNEDHLRLLETTSHVAAEAIARTVQHAETETLSLTDALTGLPNARNLHLQFENEVSRSKRTEKPFQFVMLDLDDFKIVNDTFGHKVGDVLLCEVSKIMREQLRDYDFLARYAGDEFVAILPEISDERMQELCQRIEAAIINYALPVGIRQYARVGVSIGVAAYPRGGETLDQIMIAADQNMYSIKAAHKRQRKALSSFKLPEQSVAAISQKMN
jgi:diguanylate cyclase (GGDEF)-like protein